MLPDPFRIFRITKAPDRKYVGRLGVIRKISTPHYGGNAVFWLNEKAVESVDVVFNEKIDGCEYEYISLDKKTYKVCC